MRNTFKIVTKKKIEDSKSGLKFNLKISKNHFLSWNFLSFPMKPELDLKVVTEQSQSEFSGNSTKNTKMHETLHRIKIWHVSRRLFFIFWGPLSAHFGLASMNQTPCIICYINRPMFGSDPIISVLPYIKSYSYETVLTK